MTPYEKCFDGPYHPFRDHDSGYGWGIRHERTGAVFAQVADKGCAFGTAAALNGHWDAAQVFMARSREISDDYMKRFLERK